MSETRLLIVDDEWNMRNLLRIHLIKAGYTVDEAEDGYSALRKIQDMSYDLIVLDLMMPGLDGWTVCEKIKKQDDYVPILMLTARTETKDKVKGLNIGADDYLTKPFETEELIARVRALLRRMQKQGDENGQKSLIVLGDVTMELKEHEVFVKDEPVHVTPKEYELLRLLLTYPKQVFSRERLLTSVWGMDYFGDERTVDTHIKSIRQKFKKAGLSYNLIETVWGVGYKVKGKKKE